jgi:hypothetical protein
VLLGCGAGGGGLRARGKLGCEAGLERPARERFALFFFSISISYLKQANKFEFKPRFESKHPKTMHQHECNSKLLYFIN